MTVQEQYIFKLWDSNLFTFVLPSKWAQEHSIWLRIGEVIKIFRYFTIFGLLFLVVFWNGFMFLFMSLTVFVQNLCFWAYFKRFFLHLQDYSFWTGQDRFLCSLSFSKIKNWDHSPSRTGLGSGPRTSPEQSWGPDLETSVLRSGMVWFFSNLGSNQNSNRLPYFRKVQKVKPNRTQPVVCSSVSVLSQHFHFHFFLIHI